MKGQALITIKDKNGNIKKQVKEDNVVFDIPKEILKEYIKDADLGGIGNKYDNYNNYSTYATLPKVICYTGWFGSIKVNDENCSEVDYKDFKMPVLYGGENAKQQSSNKRYAYIDTVNSSKTDNVMKKSYTWNDCPAFTLKSINLCHELMSANKSRTSLYLCLQGGFSDPYIARYGKYYFRKAPFSGGRYQFDQKLNIDDNELGEKGNWKWDRAYGRKEIINHLQVGYYNTDTSSGSPFRYVQIYPAKNNEIILLRAVDNVTDDDNGYRVKYLHVIDSTTGTLKRSFPFSQFDGFAGGSGGTIQSYYVRIASTDFGNFIIMAKSDSRTNLFIWKIPDTQTSETIPVYADISSTGMEMNDNYSEVGIVVLNEFLFYPKGAYNECITIRINDDVNNPFTLYDYIPFNNTTSKESSNLYTSYFNKYYTPTYNTWEVWYNTTALNLSEPVAVSQGDTVTIEYTITAN